MIYIKIEDKDFYNDAVVMVKSFFPRTEVSQWKEDVQIDDEVDRVLEIDTPDTTNLTKSEMHDVFKKALYQRFEKETGQSLPWGYLTGVRPSKIAYAMLEDKATDEEILDLFTVKHFTSQEKAELALDVAKTEKHILEDLDYKNGYSLYLGIPFCPTTCLYCSFTSYSMASYQKKVDLYLDCLIKEIQYTGKQLKGRRLDTVYFGGGTPTTLSAKQLDRVLTQLKECFDFSTVKELTVEAGRPDSITPDKLEVLKKQGVDRISINPQTMNQETLDLIGRRHTVEQVVEAFEMARQAGFDNINMDIILGLPGEDATMVQKTLDQIERLAPESLTVHSLAIKRAAALNIWREKYADLSIYNSDDIISMAAASAKRLGQKPYYMYRQKNMAGNLENVGYAVPGLECIYNILIMEEKQTIIALGAGASSKIVFPESLDEQHSVRIERIENVKNVDEYINRIDEMIARKNDFFLNHEIWR